MQPDAPVLEQAPELQTGIPASAKKAPPTRKPSRHPTIPRAFHDRDSALRGDRFQLMGHLTWRDTKCAVVLLVRDTETSTVLSKVPEVVREHGLFKREMAAVESTWARAVLHHPGDRNREATVTIMTFDVPSSA